MTLTPEERAELICRRHALWNASGKPSMYYTDLNEAIHAAVAENTERCASIADSYAEDENDAALMQRAWDIAAAIREGKP